MEKQEIDKLVKELNDLSEFEEQNKERMREIAHILCDFYMPNRNKNADKLWTLLKRDKESSE